MQERSTSKTPGTSARRLRIITASLEQQMPSTCIFVVISTSDWSSISGVLAVSSTTMLVSELVDLSACGFLQGKVLLSSQDLLLETPVQAVLMYS